MRIDKWLWTVRLFKTRTMAADACLGGKVKLNQSIVKPAKELKIKDEIEMKSGPITRTYEVIDFPKSRVAASLVKQFLIETTPDTEILKLETMKYVSVVKRDRGSGRPTKKERRDLDDIFNQ